MRNKHFFTIKIKAEFFFFKTNCTWLIKKKCNAEFFFSNSASSNKNMGENFSAFCLHTKQIKIIVENKVKLHISFDKKHLFLYL